MSAIMTSHSKLSLSEQSNLFKKLSLDESAKINNYLRTQLLLKKQIQTIDTSGSGSIDATNFIKNDENKDNSTSISPITNNLELINQLTNLNQNQSKKFNFLTVENVNGLDNITHKKKLENFRQQAVLKSSLVQATFARHVSKKTSQDILNNISLNNKTKQKPGEQNKVSIINEKITKGKLHLIKIYSI